MKKFNSFLQGISGIFLLIMTFLAIFQVFTRYVMEASFPWLEEVIRYLMIFTIYVGSAIAVYSKTHLSVEIFDHFMEPKKFRYLDMSRQIFITIFSTIFAFITFQFITNLIESGQVTPAMQISMGWPMAALLIGSLLMVVNGGYVFYKLLTAKQISKEGEPL